MAVTVVRKSTKLAGKAKQEKKEHYSLAIQKLSEAADELATLKSSIDEKKKSLKLLEDSYKEKLEPLLKVVDEEYQGNQTAKGEGDVYTIVLGEKAKQTNVKDVAKAYNLMKKAGGVVLLIKTLKFNLADLRSYLTPTELEEVLEEDQTGARKVTFIKK